MQNVPQALIAATLIAHRWWSCTMVLLKVIRKTRRKEKEMRLLMVYVPA